MRDTIRVVNRIGYRGGDCQGMAGEWEASEADAPDNGLQVAHTGCQREVGNVSVRGPGASSVVKHQASELERRGHQQRIG